MRIRLPKPLKRPILQCVPSKWWPGEQVSLMSLPCVPNPQRVEAVWHGFVTDLRRTPNGNFISVEVSYTDTVLSPKYGRTISLLMDQWLVDAKPTDVANYEAVLKRHLILPDRQELLKNFAVAMRRLNKELAKYNAVRAEADAVANLP